MKLAVVCLSILVQQSGADAGTAADPAAAGYVHRGATSQDVSDTALILLLKQAQPLIEADLARCENALGALSERHKHSVMLGRTLLQPGPPTTFGLKAAGWLGAVRRGREPRPSPP